MPKSINAEKNPQQYFNYIVNYMNKKTYEKIIEKFQQKLIKMIKSGKYNTPQYQYHVQVIEELTQKLNQLKD